MNNEQSNAIQNSCLVLHGDNDVDLQVATFMLAFEPETVHQGIDGPTVTGAFVVMASTDPHADILQGVFTEPLAVRRGSRMEAALCCVDEPAVKQVGATLLERLAVCPGGETSSCRALGAASLRVALRRTLGLGSAREADQLSPPVLLSDCRLT